MPNKKTKYGPYRRSYKVTLTMTGNDRNKKSFRDSLVAGLEAACRDVREGNLKVSDLIGLRRIKQVSFC